jgi:hypothetical protein
VLRPAVPSAKKKGLPSLIPEDPIGSAGGKLRSPDPSARGEHCKHRNINPNLLTNIKRPELPALLAGRQFDYAATLDECKRQLTENIENSAK